MKTTFEIFKLYFQEKIIRTSFKSCSFKSAKWSVSPPTYILFEPKF